jgi:hypothetical protein
MTTDEFAQSIGSAHCYFFNPNMFKVRGVGSMVSGSRKRLPSGLVGSISVIFSRPSFPEDPSPSFFSFEPTEWW